MTSRKSFNAAAIEAAARPLPDPVQAVVARTQPGPVVVPEQPAASEPPRPGTAARLQVAAEARVEPAGQAASRKKEKGRAEAKDIDAPGRAGKVPIQTWIKPSTRRQLRIYALQNDRTVDGLLLEALDDLFRKYKIG